MLPVFFYVVYALLGWSSFTLAWLFGKMGENKLFTGSLVSLVLAAVLAQRMFDDNWCGLVTFVLGIFGDVCLMFVGMHMRMRKNQDLKPADAPTNKRDVT